MKNIKLNMNNTKNYIRRGDDVYYSKLITEALEDVDEDDCYTEEEFWEMVKEMEMKKFGECLEHNLYKKNV